MLQTIRSRLRRNIERRDIHSRKRFREKLAQKKYLDSLGPFVLLLIMVGIGFIYAPAIKSPYYRSDDYIFLSKVTEYGLLRSLLVPHNATHFLPLYRLFMGGLYLLYPTSSLTRAGIVIFHMLNVFLIFHIVTRLTRSLFPPTIAALGYAFSLQASSCILWCINGLWIMSLTFVLLMSVFFDRFMEQYDVPVAPSSGEAGQDSSTDAVALASPSSPSLKYYYAGLVSFMLALGLFTNALAGGVLIWIYLCVRVYKANLYKRIPRFTLRIILPFLSILFAYAVTCFQVTAVNPLLQGVGSDHWSGFFTDRIGAIAGLPFDFYSTAAGRFFPFVEEYKFLGLILFFLLLLRESRRKPQHARLALFWFVFAFLTFAFPSIGRINVVLEMTHGSHAPLVDHRYFSFAVAGTCIAFGLLLSPPSLLQKGTASSGSAARTGLLVLVCATLLALSFVDAVKIRKEAIFRVEEERVFHQTVMQYVAMMDSFLHSPMYSPEEEFYSENSEFLCGPAGYFVSKRDVFKMYFPHVKNVHIEDRKQP